MVSSALLAFLAGTLSTLSPCVLPLVPIVIGTALTEHRMGPLALASGLAISFVAVGIFVATIGFAIGLDADLFRAIGASLIAAFGLVLLMPRLQAAVATAAGPVSAWAEQRMSGFGASGLGGQFALGILLGAAWSPCVGPTLGAASVLAAQGKDLGQVFLTMGFFGIGAAAPLLALGLVSREALRRWRNRLNRIGQGGKVLLGLVLIALSVSILSGVDRRIEAFLVDASPAWLTELTTRY